jgi:hypothetical protein
MLPNDIKSLSEAYLSIYEPDNDSDILDEELLFFESVEELYDDELEEIIEDSIYDLLDEGYEFDEIEEVFDDILSEAQVTTGRGGYTKLSSEKRNAPVTSGQGSRMAAQQRLSTRQERKRAEAVAKVKGAVKSTISKAKEAAKEAKFKAVDKPAVQYAAKRKLHPAPGLAARSKDPEKRRGLRAAVAKDIASRAVGKVQRGIEKAKGAVKQKAASAAVTGYVAGKMAKGAATSAGRAVGASTRSLGSKAVETTREAGRAVKGAGKGLLGRAARKVASGAGRLASRLGEEYDAYDLVLEYLLDTGHADTISEANYIMAQMDDDMIEEIIEELI